MALLETYRQLYFCSWSLHVCFCSWSLHAAHREPKLQQTTMLRQMQVTPRYDVLTALHGNDDLNALTQQKTNRIDSVLIHLDFEQKVSCK